MNPGKRRFEKTRLFFVIAAITPALVLFGAAELCVRLMGRPVNGFKAILFADDLNTPLLFTNDPVLHWRLRPDTDVIFTNQKVRVNTSGFRGGEIHPDRKSVLFVGDSTTFGWKLPETATFSHLVPHRLNERGPSSGKWQSFNAGVPGYTSHQVMLWTQEILKRRKPEYLVVCIGNNEAWPAEKSDSQIHDENDGSAYVSRVLYHSQFFLWAKELIRPQIPKPFIASTLRDAGPRVDLDAYIMNIHNVVSRARELGIRVILLSPPVNLLYPPFRLHQIQGYEDFEKNWIQVMTLVQNGQVEHAVSFVKEQRSLFPDRFDLLWLHGFLTIKRERRKGVALLESAFEKHPFPERCKGSYRKALAEYAKRHGICYLDINALFNPENKGEYREDLYMDQCHPTEEGHAMIANALVSLILKDAATNLVMKNTGHSVDASAIDDCL
jgi:lysophospholipase L1-like esterase